MADELRDRPMPEMVLAILTLVEKHDGQLSFYQLDRSLSALGIIPNGMMAAIDDLLRQNCMIAESDGPMIKRYRITDRGRERLRNCVPESTA